MACKPSCRLCPRLVISQAVTFNGTSLVINLPTGCYNDDQKVCVVVAQSIPATTTINAPVVITIGTGTVQYPVTRCNCTPLTACSIGSRSKYSMRVETTTTGAVFRLIGRPCCVNRNLASINGTAPTTSTTTVAADD